MVDYKFTYDIDAVLHYLETNRIDISPADRNGWVKLGLAIKAAGGTAETFVALSRKDAGNDKACREQWKRDTHQYLDGKKFASTNGNRELAIGYIVNLCKDARIDLARFRVENDNKSRAPKRYTPRTSSPVPPTPVRQPLPPAPVPPPDGFDYIAAELADRITSHRAYSSLYAWLCRYYDRAAVDAVFVRYRVGTTRYMHTLSNSPATAFCYINAAGQCTDVKIVAYHDGRRVHSGCYYLLDPSPETDPAAKYQYTQRFANWPKQTQADMFSILNYIVGRRNAVGEVAPANRAPAPLFGEHLLASWPTTARVNVVESEKTALIASLEYPNELFLATGGKGNFTVNKLAVLHPWRILAHPDIDGVTEWTKTAERLNQTYGFRIAINKQVQEHNGVNGGEKADIADLIIMRREATLKPIAPPPPKVERHKTTPMRSIVEAQELLSEMVTYNPALLDLIQTFDLEPVKAYAV